MGISEQILSNPNIRINDRTNVGNFHPLEFQWLFPTHECTFRKTKKIKPNLIVVCVSLSK